MTRLFDGEPWEVRANMVQYGRAVGGKLVVGGGSVRFSPHRLDRATGGDDHQWDVRALTSVDRAPRTWHPFDGGVRRRLRLRFADGGEALFEVNHVRETGHRLASSAQAHGAVLSVGL
jgi:hypothetical protein